MKPGTSPLAAAVLAACLLLCGCAAGQPASPNGPSLPTPAATASSTPTTRPTATLPPSPSPSPTLAASPTWPSSGKEAALTESGELALLDFDHHYTLLLPPGSTLEDPRAPISGLPPGADGRFLAYVAPYEAQFLVICYQAEVEDLESLLQGKVEEIATQPRVRVTNEIVVNGQGQEVGFIKYQITLSSSDETVYYNYNLLFLVEGGFCATYSTLEEGNDPFFHLDFQETILWIAAALTFHGD